MLFEDFSVVSAAFLLFIIYKLVDWLLRLPVVRRADRCVLITGCDTGFGHDLAKRLDSRGCHVFAGCLTEKGETELRKVCSDRLVTVALDISKPESVRRAFRVVAEQLQQSGKELWAVVNNAGVLLCSGPPDWCTVDDYRRVADVNLYGPIDVTMTFLPLIKKSRGRVVNMSSTGGRLCYPFLTDYCVTKYGIEAFSDGIRRSLRPYGVKVSIVGPTAFRTNIIPSDGLASVAERTWSRIPPEVKEEYGEEYHRYATQGGVRNAEKTTSDRISDVTDVYEHAIFARFPRARYIVGNNARIMTVIQALPEWLGDWIMERLEADWPLPAAVKKLQ